MIRKTLSVSCSAALALALALPAGAAPNQTRAWIAGKVLKVRDASTGSYYSEFDNYVSVKVKRDEGAAYIRDDAGSTIAGPGCTIVGDEDVSAGRPEDLYYPLGPGDVVRCPFTDLRKVDINTGPGYDVAYVVLSHVPSKIVGGEGDDELGYFACEPPPYWSTTNINGGLGSDYITGGLGDDVLVGSRGDETLEGTCGKDRISAGAGFDLIRADDTNWCGVDCPPTTDVINCGDGDDTVDTDGVDVIFGNCE